MQNDVMANYEKTLPLNRQTWQLKQVRLMMHSAIVRSTARKVLVAVFFLGLYMAPAQAQRTVVVDVQKVLDAMPEYKKAQEDLDKLAQKWRQEIAQEQDVIKGMYNKYQAEQVLLSEDLRKQREEEILNKEKGVRDMQRDKFGPEGALFKKRQELVRPIQERVYAAIEDYAAQKGFDLIFDKSGSAGLIFTNPEFDKTEDIIKLLKK
jgi:outer membrane protein